MEKQVVPHSIYAESTPNPAVLKFVSNKYLVVDGEDYEYGLEDDTANSPFAAKLLNYPFISNVFIASNFVALTKTDIVEWEDVIQQLREVIAQYLNEGGKVIIQSKSEMEGNQENVSVGAGITIPERRSLQGIEAKIAGLLDEYVKPAVEGDGGAIHFHSYDQGTVKVVLKGACSGCPSSTMTLKSGIENLLQQMLPGEVQSVEAING
jgi:Fe-S cluster biogenesis protein NfuA